jgi:ferric-dicitrate binding protein FerR (iron transport regulator)
MDKNILHRFFEGKTSLEEEEVIKEWLESSSGNQAIFLEERRLYDTLLLLGKTVGEPQLQSPRKSYKSYTIIKEIVKIAAVSTVVLFLSNLYHKKPEENVEVQFQTISVPVGQRINITLPDGSDVWLNARTSITYPLSFNKENRQVQLDGEAYFNVMEDKTKPFIVQTAKSRLEVLGTIFNVEDYADKEDFETMLFDGSVKIVPRDSLLQAVTLTPAYKAFLNGGKLEVVKENDYSVYRWREGLICFKNVPFLTIMNDFEKYYGLKIIVENEHVKKQHYSGKFRQTDGVDYALRVLQKDIRFSYKRDDDNSRIYIR